jgi:hypothetical protein
MEKKGHAEKKGCVENGAWRGGCAARVQMLCRACANRRLKFDAQDSAKAVRFWERPLEERGTLYKW